MRSLFGEPLERTNRLHVVAVVVGVERPAATRIEVEAPRVVVRVRNRRPIAAVRTCIAEESPKAVAGAGEKDTIRSIIALATNDISINSIHCRPSPITLAVKGIELLFRRHPPIAAPMIFRRIMLWSKNAI